MKHPIEIFTTALFKQSVLLNDAVCFHCKKWRRLYVIVACLLLFVTAKANDNDSTINRRNKLESILNWNFVAVPTVSYQPETNWAFGAAGAYYFNCKNQTRTSDISFDGCYALSHQYSFNISNTTYFNEDSRWRMSLNLKFRKFQDYLYGFGNDGNVLFDNRQAYVSRILEFKAMPQRAVAKDFYIGPAMSFRWEQPIMMDSLVNVQTGAEAYHMLGVGLVLTYDTRNQVNYTHDGVFLKFIGQFFEPTLGSSYRMTSLNVDWRHFVPIYKNFVFAYQCYGNMVIGNEKPFQMLSTTGGIDQSRGIRSGYWRDDLSLMLQAELRIPIWRFLKAAVFGSVADVYNLQQWHWAVPKFAYGAGLRVAINQAKVNVRFDVAQQTYTHSWSCYFTVREAF
ncbi:MAG: BamA/TamA family outer membrane protein [Bacteroidales bacterium]|nr:BamA/TamA family outer membrane protein [Bacteroidales bacterium]